MTYDYSAEGICHNAEPGTYGHECGKPAVWIGVSPRGNRFGFCDKCRREGYDARGIAVWERARLIIS